MALDVKHHVAPAMFTVPWLWAIFALLLIGVGITEWMVQWDKRPPVGRKDLKVVLAGAIVGVPSVVGDWAFPGAASIAWPVACFALIALGVAIRWWSIRLLGADFNGDLKTRPGQVAVTAGPYRVVRNPGYLGAALTSFGLLAVFGFWLLLILGTVALAVGFRRRVLKEEPINRANIAGYDQYIETVRHRMIPGLW